MRMSKMVCLWFRGRITVKERKRTLIAIGVAFPVGQVGISGVGYVAITFTLPK